MSTHYYIDPTAGTDTLGSTSQPWGRAPNEAFRTHEFFRREVIGDAFVDGDVEVDLLDDFTEDNPVIVDFSLGPDASLTYRGVKSLSVVHTGSFDDVRPISAGQNQAQEVKDGALTSSGWSGAGLVNQIGKLPDASLRRIRVTGGASAGSMAYACKDLGGGWARTSPFGLPAASPTEPSPPTKRRFTPASGDPFAVEAGFVRIDSLAVDVKVSPVVPSFPKVHLMFADLELNPERGHSHHVRARAKPITGGPSTITFTGCGLGRLAPQYANKVVLEFCRLDHSNFQGTLVQLAGCCCLGEVVVFEGARAVAYADTIFQDRPLRVQGLARLGEVSFFDADRAGLQVEQNGTVRVEELVFGGVALYGNGHTVTGAQVRAGGCIVYDGPDALNAAQAGISITGAEGDVDVAGKLKQWKTIAPDYAPQGKRAAVARNDQVPATP